MDCDFDREWGGRPPSPRHRRRFHHGRFSSERGGVLGMGGNGGQHEQHDGGISTAAVDEEEADPSSSTTSNRRSFFEFFRTGSGGESDDDHDRPAPSASMNIRSRPRRPLSSIVLEEGAAYEECDEYDDEQRRFYGHRCDYDSLPPLSKDKQGAVLDDYGAAGPSLGLGASSPQGTLETDSETLSSGCSASCSSSEEDISDDGAARRRGTRKFPAVAPLGAARLTRRSSATHGGTGGMSWRRDGEVVDAIARDRRGGPHRDPSVRGAEAEGKAYDSDLSGGACKGHRRRLFHRVDDDGRPIRDDDRRWPSQSSSGESPSPRRVRKCGRASARALFLFTGLGLTSLAGCVNLLSASSAGRASSLLRAAAESTFAPPHAWSSAAVDPRLVPPPFAGSYVPEYLSASGILRGAKGIVEIVWGGASGFRKRRRTRELEGARLADLEAIRWTAGSDKKASGRQRLRGGGYTVRLRPPGGSGGTWSRLDLLAAAADALAACPAVDAIELEGGRGATGATKRVRHPSSKVRWLRSDESEKAGEAAGVVSGSSHPHAQRSDAVLLLDADVSLTCAELDRGYRAWTQTPERMVGYFPYRHRPRGSAATSDGEDAPPAWTVNPVPIRAGVPYTLVSDRAAFVHRRYLRSKLLSVAAAGNTGNVRSGPKGGRCDRLRLSVAISFASGEPPVAVVGRPVDLRRRGRTRMRTGLDPTPPSSTAEDNGDKGEGGFEEGGGGAARCLGEEMARLGLTDLPVERTVYLGGSMQQ